MTFLFDVLSQSRECYTAQCDLSYIMLSESIVGLNVNWLTDWTI